MGVYNVSSYQFGISGLLDTPCATDDLYGAFLRLLLVVFYVLKQVSIYCSCLQRTLRRRFAVKLLNCFCRRRKPPLTFHQHVGEEITAVFTYFSGVNCSFKIQTCWPWARHPAGGSSGGCSCRTDSQPGFKNTQKTDKKEIRVDAAEFLMAWRDVSWTLHTCWNSVSRKLSTCRQRKHENIKSCWLTFRKNLFWVYFRFPLTQEGLSAPPTSSTSSVSQITCSWACYSLPEIKWGVIIKVS